MRAHRTKIDDRDRIMCGLTGVTLGLLVPFGPWLLVWLIRSFS